LIRFFIILIAFASLNLSSIAQPSFTTGGNVTVQQNAGAYSANWTTPVNATSPSFEIQSINYVGFLSFASDPAIDAAGTLSFEPTANRSGEAIVKVALRDLDNNQLSIPVTFRIIVEFINTAPTFTVANGDQLIDEKAGEQTVLGWATDISPGPNPDEVNQGIAFTTSVVSTSAFMSFRQAPEVSPSGTLTYEVEEVANGSATIEVILTDDGSDVAPNANSSTTCSFTITVNPINDRPSFIAGDNIKVDEHAGLVTIAGWATNISAGPPDEEASQNLTFVVVENSITTFLQFDSPVTVDANGTLSFQATNHYNGVAVYEIYLLDDGPSDSPNNNRSSSLGFTVSVDFINDAPSFVKGSDIEVEEGTTIYTFPGWATDISPGESPNEQDQELRFSVVFQQVTGTLAFLRIPEIDANGQLIFQATEHTHGEAIFDVYLIDDGDFEPPNENQSPVESFTLTVTPVNYPPNNLFLSNNVILEKQPSGTFVGTFSASDQDPEDTHNYNLVLGDGSDGNDSFIVDGESLLTAEEFDWETQRQYFIRVKTSDGEFSFEKSFRITIEKLIEGIKFPNAITPNGDGENDTWEIEDIEAFPDVTVFIYDGAGQNVYKSKQGYIPWDGTYNGRELPMGTYYYIIDLNDGINTYKGTITIIK
jgi:gliding motility-associated-like protein